MHGQAAAHGFSSEQVMCQERDSSVEGGHKVHKHAELQQLECM